MRTRWRRGKRSNRVVSDPKCRHSTRLRIRRGRIFGTCLPVRGAGGYSLYERRRSLGRVSPGRLARGRRGDPAGGCRRRARRWRRQSSAQRARALRSGLGRCLVLVDTRARYWDGMLARWCPDCKTGGKPVTILTGSTSTWTDAQLVHAYCVKKGIKRILVVTDPYHSRRAFILFKRRFAGSGIHVTAVNSDDYRHLLPPTGKWWHDEATLQRVVMEAGRGSRVLSVAAIRSWVMVDCRSGNLEVIRQSLFVSFVIPSPQVPWERRHLAGIRGYRPRESKAVSPDRRLGDACRLEGGAPGHGLLRLPRRERG